MDATLYYVHDPMCSWCWAFRPTFDVVSCSLPEGVILTQLLGGLAPDTSIPMPEEMRQYIQKHWKTIQEKVPGTQFNFDFWSKCYPRRSTYPACRAVIAARNQGKHFENKMILAIQQGYYLNARNPSETNTLIEFASEIGLGKNKFTSDLNSENTNRILIQEIDRTRQLGVSAFPSLLLVTKTNNIRIPVKYGEPDYINNAIDQSLKSQGLI